MTRFYDWANTLSRYNPATNQAETTLVIGGRGIGKTFGLRKHLVQRFQKHGELWVEIVRYANELKAVQDGYFRRFEDLGTFPGFMFMTRGNCGFIAEVPNGDERPAWYLCCYFVALTQQQSLKKVTFSPFVRYVVMDEAILDKKDSFHRYLKNEFAIFANMLSTIFREVPGDGKKRQVILMGNSCDMLNPYFEFLGIDFAPEYGKNWYKHKSVLLDYVEAWDAEERMEQTLVGRLLSGNAEQRTMFSNEFENANLEFVASKSRGAKFRFAIAYNSRLYGIWLDWQEGIYYVTDQVPQNHESHVFALSNADNKIDYQVARRTELALDGLRTYYYENRVRYSSPAIKGHFAEVLKLFGIR